MYNTSFMSLLTTTCFILRSQEISSKTSDLINNLKSLAVVPEEGGEPQVTIELLKERKMQASTENFLFNLAVAEGLVRNFYS